MTQIFKRFDLSTYISTAHPQWPSIQRTVSSSLKRQSTKKQQITPQQLLLTWLNLCIENMLKSLRFTGCNCTQSLKISTAAGLKPSRLDSTEQLSLLKTAKHHTLHVFEAQDYSFQLDTISISQNLKFWEISREHAKRECT